MSPLVCITSPDEFKCGSVVSWNILKTWVGVRSLSCTPKKEYLVGGKVENYHGKILINSVMYPMDTSSPESTNSFKGKEKGIFEVTFCILNRMAPLEFIFEMWSDEGEMIGKKCVVKVQ